MTSANTIWPVWRQGEHDAELANYRCLVGRIGFPQYRQQTSDPTRVATGTASSHALSRRRSPPLLPPDADPVVVELGARTGPVTDVVAARLGGRGRHLAIELKPTLATRLPGVAVMCADARGAAVGAAQAGDRPRGRQRPACSRGWRGPRRSPTSPPTS